MMKNIEDIPDLNPFRIPEGYFEEVNRKILSVTSDKEEGKRKSGIYLRLRPFLLAAASVTVFILLSYTAFKLVTLHRNDQHEARILTEGTWSMYINDLDIFSIEENMDPVALPAAVPDVSRAEIIDYLVFENIEINTIYEQL